MLGLIEIGEVKRPFVSDMCERDSLYAAVVAGKYSHAELVGVDISGLKRFPSVRAVVTGEKGGESPWSCAGGRVRYAGEPIAVVCALSREEAEAAARYVRVHYLPLETVSSMGEALERCAAGTSRADLEKNMALRAEFGKRISTDMFERCDVSKEKTYSFFREEQKSSKLVRVKFGVDGRLTVVTESDEKGTAKAMAESRLGYTDLNIVSCPRGCAARTFLPEILASRTSRASGGRWVVMRYLSPPEKRRVQFEVRMRIGYKNGRIFALEVKLRIDCGAYCINKTELAKELSKKFALASGAEHFYCLAELFLTNNPPLEGEPSGVEKVLEMLLAEGREYGNKDETG